MKIAILGGSFNPVHKAHLQMIDQVDDEFVFDKIILVPAYNPKYKPALTGAEDKDRIKMLQLAVEDEGRLYDVNTFDIDNKNSYTNVLVEALKKDYPNDQLYFIMGSDSFKDFGTWVKPDEIVKYATIICVLRDGESASNMDEYVEEYTRTFGGTYYISYAHPDYISSTMIRRLIEAGSINKISDMVTPSVRTYIADHKLYTDNRKYNYKFVLDLQDKMRDELKKSRYIHTVGVAHTAAQMASKWGYDSQMAMVAGMLHDCAKCISDDKRIEICEKNNIEIKPIERKFPHLLHGKVGAFWAETKYDVDNEEILHSIKIHTTGEPEMNLLDKIIFVADYIEPGRDAAPHLTEIRRLAYTDLDKCVYKILDDTIYYLGADKDSIDSTTYDAYEYYYQIINNR